MSALAPLASSVSPDAVLGAVVTCTIVVGTALWKLASMLAEVRSEVRHNGGGSLKDKIHSIGSSVDQIKTTVDANAKQIENVDTRVTQHRRRNEDAVASLREHLDKKLATLAEGQIRSDGLQSVLHELGMKERHDEREG